MAESTQTDLIGRPLDRVDGPLKVTGKAPYAYEYAAQGAALYGVIVPASIAKGRRQLLWFEVTRHPTAAWLARQITEAFPWSSAPVYLVRDNDRAYGHVFTSRVRAMGIRDRPISLASPWQNGCADRLIGTLRRECLDQVVISGALKRPRRPASSLRSSR